MDDNHDNTSVDTPSPDPPSPQDRTLEEILAQSSTELIHTFAESINQGALKEANKSEAFRQELKRRVLRNIIRTYVWSNGRLVHETQTAEARLGNGVQELLSTEREQDRLRARLSELVAAVSRAVEMFAGF